MYTCKNKYTVYLLIIFNYWTAKNNYLGIIGTDFYRACEVSGIIRTSKAAACELTKSNRTVCDWIVAL